MGPGTPYFRLSSFYLFYFASLGAFMPYWGVYLQSLGFAPRQIGELFAISLITKVFSPYIWGWIADHTGHRLAIIRWTSFLAALAFAGVLFSQTYLWLVLVLSIYSFFWHAALPQFEAITINHLGEHRTRYSHIRLWGSVGFIVTVTGLGFWFENAGHAALPLLLIGLLAGIWGSTLLIRDSSASEERRGSLSIGQTLRRPEVVSFLIACFLLQASHGPYYAFFSIYLSEHGYSEVSIGQFWALGVVAEIGVFLFAHRWLKQMGAARLFRISMLVTAVRWVLIAVFVDTLPVLLLAQVMHAASYGLYHASGIELVNRFFPGRLQGRGQALYSSVSFGLGNALGILASGYLWVPAGASRVYGLASLACLLGLIVSTRVTCSDIE